MSDETVQVELSNDYTAVIDSADWPIVKGYHWHGLLGKSGIVYAAASPHKRVTVYMHRLLLDAPAGARVSHHDHDGLNNRRSNISIRTCSEILRHNRGNGRNSSGYRGVTYNRQIKRWVAQIGMDGVNTYIGTRDTAEDAARLYDETVRERFGEFASTNFPQALQPQMSN